MKKLDQLMIKSFLGPFILTTVVSDFILLVQYLLKYFDDFVGKNLGATVFAELLFYFALNMLQVALPLGVLVSSLMTFGNLGEHFELTAIKSSGISLLRILRPIFVFVFFLSIGAFFFNNYAIPAANLKAYSLLYDIKQTKPALDIKEGSFYNGIPDYSIKANDKLPDGKTLLDIIIYDHSEGRGNKNVILADSGLMYTILDDRYLKLELFNGNYYSEQTEDRNEIDRFYQTQYHKMDLVFSLSSFDLKRRKEELFQNNRQMKNISELSHDIDSFKTVIRRTKFDFVSNSKRYFNYHLESKKGILQEEVKEDTVSVQEISASLMPSFIFQKPVKDQKKKSSLPKKIKEKSSALADSSKRKAVSVIPQKKDFEKKRKVASSKNLGLDMTLVLKDTLTLASLEQTDNVFINIQNALNKARSLKVNVNTAKIRVYQLSKDENLYTIEKFKKYAQALACILMFMVGAPLGAIIKKGGLGMPTIIAIIFFIIYYVFTSIGEKSAKEGAMNPYFAVWMSDLVLLPFGLFFLRQARIDARLFDTDFYNIWVEKLKRRFARKGKEV
ncbi:MAG: LptF/LptG family permease [Ekhidna sp.]